MLAWMGRILERSKFIVGMVCIQLTLVQRNLVNKNRKKMFVKLRKTGQSFVFVFIIFQEWYVYTGGVT